MTDLFISYAREDRAQAEALVQALEAEGFRVWWDRSISPGENFDDVIESALRAATCVVVLWSSRSVVSRWVRAEAAEGAERDILVPALIEDVEIPLAFRRIQAANLLSDDGTLPIDGLAALIAAIRRVLGQATVDQGSALPKSLQTIPRSPSRRASLKFGTLRWRIILIAVSLLMLFLVSQSMKIEKGEVTVTPEKEQNAPGP